MQTLPINCQECGLFSYSPSPFCKGRGNNQNPDIVMIGEAPGPDEAIAGICFVGRAGRKLNEMIKGYESKIYITNMVKCFPPLSTRIPTAGFRVPKEKEIELCKPFLEYELDEISKTKLMVTNPILMPLGNSALKGLIPNNKGITKELGIVKECVIGGRHYSVIPNYHPSYILRNNNFRPDFEKVLKIAMTEFI